MGIKHKLISCIITLVTVLVGASSAFALSQPTAVYDAVVKTAGNYAELAGATTSYNCLAYALGNTSSWVWPWGSNNPTISQVNTYLWNYDEYLSHDMDTTNPDPPSEIIAYGSTSSIAHFSKIADKNYTNAKWGSLERLQSLGWDPYKTYANGGPYGSAVRQYGRY